MGKQGKRYGRHRMDSGHHHRILLVMGLLGLLAFVPVGLRLWGLMIRDYDHYARLARNNQSRTTRVAADRGDILDRNLQLLATDVSVENVYLDPHELKQSGADVGAIARVLGELLEKDPGWIQEQAGDTRMRYKQVGSRIEEETAGKIREYITRNNISGIHLEPSLKRTYPWGTLAAQVIGFANAEGKGSEGVEAAYDSYLTGKAGRVVTTKGSNEMDMPFSYENYIADQPGCDVVLTLDAVVQSCLEKQLEAAVARYDVQNGAFGLVMDCRTGEILAMATLGSYDPNCYLEILDPKAAARLEALQGQPEHGEALTAARLKQWRNRCLSDGYEPGSTFKVLTMAAALDCGAIDLDTRFFCAGAEQIPGRSQLLHCWRSTGHGSQQTAQALQNSCNLAFAHIALKLGGEKFYEYVEKFGILEKTGIDLAGESRGVFFDRALITDTDKWGTASLTSASFGQTFKLTPLQLVRAIASVVNGGYLPEPYLVSQVVDHRGNTVLKQEPSVLRRTISGETSALMCSLLTSVVTEGTAKNAAVAGFSIGGKTGTSEKIDVFDERGQRVQDKIVSFVGIAPMEAPRYIVLAALDTPSRDTGIYISGGVMAAPTVGAVMGDILPYLGVAQKFAPEEAGARLQILEDYTGLTRQEAESRLKELALVPEFSGGASLVTAQLPGPGQQIPGGSQVLLYLGEDPEGGSVAVPDFAGLNRQQAADRAGLLGLYILPRGNPEIAPRVTVTAQSIPPETRVPRGTTVTLTFTDTLAKD